MPAVILFTAVWTGCKKDDDPVSAPPPVVNDPEVITTVKLFFDDTTVANLDRVAVFRDPDGDGGAGPDIFDTIKLQPNKSYLVNIILLNETLSPADTISNDVLAEANDHMFFYMHSGVSITTTYLDQDTNNPPLPIGLSTRWQTGNLSTGTSRIILKHQPGVKDGTQAPGTTDVDVTFQARVE